MAERNETELMSSRSVSSLRKEKVIKFPDYRILPIDHYILTMIFFECPESPQRKHSEMKTCLKDSDVLYSLIPSVCILRGA